MYMKTKLSSLGICPSKWFASCRATALSFLLLMSIAASAQLQLVKDINTTPESSGPTVDDEAYSRLTDVNGTLFFILNGRELWVSSSSTLSASFLKEFEQVSNLVNVNGELFFTADNGENGVELWKSDGTPAGTLLVRDIRPGAMGSDLSGLTNLNGKLLFAANDGATGKELWKSDGTQAGTVRVKDILRVVGSSNPTDIVAMNGLLYFTANDGQRGYELWKSDGTEGGTTLVKDILTDTRVSSRPQHLVNANGLLFFIAIDPSGNRRLYKSDGTAAGTMKVSDAPADLQEMTNVNGTLFFSARDAAHGRELWKSDGTSAGTVLVKDLTPGPGSSTGYGTPHLSYLTSANGKLYFNADSPGPAPYSNTESLWVSDGTEAGTQRLTEFPDIVFSFINPFIHYFHGKVYFTATTNNNLSILRTDGTPNGDEEFIPNIAFGYTSDAQLTVVDDYLYYISHGNVWRTDGTTTTMVTGTNRNTLSSFPEPVVNVNGTLYFSAYDGLSHGLWKSDGTEAGTSLIQYFANMIQYPTPSGNYLYYMADAIDTETMTMDWKLWRTDLTTGATTWVSDINPGGVDYIADLEDVNGTLYFSIEVPTEPGQEFPREAQLWKTTGTLASTQHIKTFNDAGLPPPDLTNVNGTLFFSAVTDPNIGPELWKSDGTESGTVMVKKINPNPLEPSEPRQLTPVNNTLYFIAYTGDYELWKSDGTAAGTVMVKDMRTDDQNQNDIDGLTKVNGTLYFTSAGESDGSGNYMRDLWKTDGSEVGTVKVATFPPYRNDAVGNPVATGLKILGMINSNLIVGLQYITDFHMGPVEIWKTDETAEGTEMVLGPVDNVTNFNSIVSKNNVIYFTGSSGNTPTDHLWRTDGSTCGTFLVTEEGDPGNLTGSHGEIYLSYTDPRYGRELFVLEENEINVPCTTLAQNSGSSASVISREIDEDKEFANYPNPFMTDFVLNVSGEEGGSFQLIIKDMKGANITERMQLPFNRDHKLGAALTPGVYLLQISKRNGMAVKKIIKTN
jgi:ELWxxDGT repeat protein